MAEHVIQGLITLQGFFHPFNRFPEEDIKKLLSLKLYDLDEKQFLKMREQLQTDDVASLVNFISNL